MTEKSAVLKRFLSYVIFDTRSNEPKPGQESAKPSSHGQEVLAQHIIDEVMGMFMGGEDVIPMEDGSFLVTIPATPGHEHAPHVVFASHLDTYYNFNGAANAIIHEYAGGDILLPKNGVVIPASHLAGLEGQRIVTSDGTSVLGADDKAGVAALVTAIEMLLSPVAPAHGPVTFWFCVDEEVGELDIKVIPKDVVESWDVLWTVDGERVGQVSVGSFICRRVVATFQGMDAHPGVNGENLKPAQYAAIFMAADIVGQSTPKNTRGLEAFHYVTGIEGNASEATVTCMPRSFKMEESDAMVERIREAAKNAAQLYGCTFQVNDNVICGNIRSAVMGRMDLVDPGIRAHKQAGFEPDLVDIRGGTDGAMVNKAYPNLPAPNIGVGGKNFHGPQEYLVVSDLEVLPGILLATLANTALLKSLAVAPTISQGHELPAADDPR